MVALTAGIACLLPTIEPVQAINFTDDFESSALDPFWTTNTVGGAVVFPSTVQAHGGVQSVTFSLPVSSQSYLFLEHSLPHFSYGTVSVWVYDPLGSGSGNYFGLYLLSSTNSSTILNIQTYDYDNNYYHCQIIQSYSTTTHRTLGWHLFVIQSAPAALNFSIDGTNVYSGSGNKPFDKLRIGMYGANRASIPYFDDFQFVEQPTSSVLNIAMYAGLTITGTIGFTNEIQYQDSLNSSNWLPLADIVLPTSPYFFVDTNSAYSPQRFYRAVAQP